MADGLAIQWDIQLELNRAVANASEMLGLASIFPAA
tara:strand:+ start:1884 stop:1991 length:108 start_codon:yes stop_codon:yes gene_type:complete